MAAHDPVERVLSIRGMRTPPKRGRRNAGISNLCESEQDRTGGKRANSDQQERQNRLHRDSYRRIRRYPEDIEELRPQVNLSKREEQCLIWPARGKTYQDISDG